MENIIERYFTQHLKETLFTAQSLAAERKNGSHDISILDLMKAMSLRQGSVGGSLLSTITFFNNWKKRFKQKQNREEQIKKYTHLSFSKEAYQCLIGALRLAQQFKFPYVGTEHLLLSILINQSDEIRQLVEKSKSDFEKISSQLRQVLNRTFDEGEKSVRIIGSQNNIFDSPAEEGGKDEMESGKNNNNFTNELGGLFSSLIENSFRPERRKGFSVPPPQISGRRFKPSFGLVNFEESDSPFPFLDHFARNLNQEVISGKVDPVIGREKETENLIRILIRKSKNNPVLVGEPGVGKTALVSALASRVINRDVPPALSKSIIYSLDMGLLVAGTTFRGEFEERFKNIIEEAEKNPNIILFIDEIHNLVGAGSAQGSLDAANIMKPALARGLIRCIGATTSDEYQKYIEKDGALERRFQPVWIKEPGLKKTETILLGLKEHYENFHKVSINPEAIKKTVLLADRFLNDRFMPDKAIDLLDETASYVVMNHYRQSNAEKLEKLALQKEKIEQLKERIVEQNDLELAESLLKNERDLNFLIDQFKVKAEEESKIKPVVTAEDVTKVLAEKLDLPKELVSEDIGGRLSNLLSDLKQKIKGQDRALERLTGTLQRSFTGVADPNRPASALLFIGPSGVGKTHTAKTLAKKLFLRNDALIRVDMSEFSEKHTASKLVGSPPGYVGYGERTGFIEKVRKNPYSLLLFDEVEKAHPEIFNLFLQILEDGHLTDGTGRKINFKNTLIVFTSNAFSNEIARSPLGFKESREATSSKVTERVIREKLDSFLKPEFINRISEVINFDPLGRKALAEIAQLELNKLKNRLKKKNILVRVAPKVTEFLAEKSFNPREGVRLLRKKMQRDLEEKVAEKLASESKKSVRRIRISIDKKRIRVR